MRSMTPAVIFIAFALVCRRYVVGLAGPVATPPLITPQLPTNRRGRYLQRRGDALLIMSGFLQRVSDSRRRLVLHDPSACR